MSSGGTQFVMLTLELGHMAALRTEDHPQGFTHDWRAFVRSADNRDIQACIEKVVFRLHETFARPIQEKWEPPYQIEESGYAEFDLLIDVYFKNEGQPKHIEYKYNLRLPQIGDPPVKHARQERLTFKNPPAKFRQKLLACGGTLTGDASSILRDRDLASAREREIPEPPTVAREESKKKGKKDEGSSSSGSKTKEKKKSKKSAPSSAGSRLGSESGGRSAQPGPDMEKGRSEAKTKSGKSSARSHSSGERSDHKKVISPVISPEYGDLHESPYSHLSPPTYHHQSTGLFGTMPASPPFQPMDPSPVALHASPPPPLFPPHQSSKAEGKSSKKKKRKSASAATAHVSDLHPAAGEARSSQSVGDGRGSTSAERKRSRRKSGSKKSSANSAGRVPILPDEDLLPARLKSSYTPNSPTADREPATFGTDPAAFGIDPATFGTDPTTFGTDPTTFGTDPDDPPLGRHSLFEQDSPPSGRFLQDCAEPEEGDYDTNVLIPLHHKLLALTKDDGALVNEIARIVEESNAHTLSETSFDFDVRNLGHDAVEKIRVLFE